jgi:hypothetical protein
MRLLAVGLLLTDCLYTDFRKRERHPLMKAAGAITGFAFLIKEISAGTTAADAGAGAWSVD